MKSGFGSFLHAFAESWFTLMSGPLTVPFTVAAVFVPPVWLKTLLALLAVVCAVTSSYAVWRREREATMREREATMLERQKNERPELVGGITCVSKAPLSVIDSRCRIQIEAWIRNDRHVETGVRIAAVALSNTPGEALFIPSLSVQQPTTNLVVKLQTERLEYGRRVEGSLLLDVEAPMTSVDPKSATVTVVDDFDQTTVLRC